MLCRSLVVLTLFWTTVASGQEKLPLSQVIAEGIGRRFPPTAPPLVLDAWPTPLRESPGAMMMVAISPDGAQVATGASPRRTRP